MLREGRARYQTLARLAASQARAGRVRVGAGTQDRGRSLNTHLVLRERSDRLALDDGELSHLLHYGIQHRCHVVRGLPPRVRATILTGAACGGDKARARALPTCHRRLAIFSDEESAEPA